MNRLVTALAYLWIISASYFNWAAVGASVFLFSAVLLTLILVVFSSRRVLSLDRKLINRSSIVLPVLFCTFIVGQAENDCNLVTAEHLFSEFGFFVLILSGVLVWMLIISMDVLRLSCRQHVLRGGLLLLQVTALCSFGMSLVLEIRNGFASC